MPVANLMNAEKEVRPCFGSHIRYLPGSSSSSKTGYMTGYTPGELNMDVASQLAINQGTLVLGSLPPITDVNIHHSCEARIYPKDM